jgi:hypothetical protein
MLVTKEKMLNGGEAVADCCFAGVAAELLSSTQKRRCNKIQCKKVTQKAL